METYSNIYEKNNINKYRSCDLKETISVRRKSFYIIQSNKVANDV